MKPFNKAFSPAAIIASLAILLSACGPAATPSPTTDVSIFYTQAASTIAVGLTQTVAAQPSATLPAPTTAITDTPQPSDTPVQITNPGLTPAPTATNPPAPAGPSYPSSTPVPVDPGAAFGCYNASFVANIPPWFAPTFSPGQHFTKTWRVKNTGSCDWPRGFLIVFGSGNRFGADTTTIDQKVPTGSTADITLSMVAPSMTGLVSSNWMLATDVGKPFGPVLSVSITLPGIANATIVSNGCLNSLLISDVTIPSGTKLNAKDTFTKTWQIENTGTCNWTGTFKINFLGGDPLGADTTKISRTVVPGATTEISLKMTAPSTSDTYQSTWQMASDTGQLFGQVLQFSIVVK